MSVTKCKVTLRRRRYSRGNEFVCCLFPQPAWFPDHISLYCIIEPQHLLMCQLFASVTTWLCSTMGLQRWASFSPLSASVRSEIPLRQSERVLSPGLSCERALRGDGGSWGMTSGEPLFYSLFVAPEASLSWSWSRLQLCPPSVWLSETEEEKRRHYVTMQWSFVKVHK